MDKRVSCSLRETRETAAKAHVAHHAEKPTTDTEKDIMIKIRPQGGPQLRRPLRLLRSVPSTKP